VRQFILLISLSLIFNSGLCAETSFTQKVDRYLQPYLQMQDFSGCVLIAKQAQVLTRKCYGDANYELNVANAPTSRFHIASVTKSFTAAAIVILQKRGQLQLTDKLSHYIPDFPSGDKITILDLLNHSSGIPSYYAIPEYQSLRAKPVGFDELIAIMRTKPLDFEPGTKSSYSDTGYAFLAYIIEKVSGKPYGQFIADEIFTPLGMKNSGTFSDTALIPERATGYQPWIEGPRINQIANQKLRIAPFYDKTIITGSGSLYSTIDDLYLFYKGMKDKRLFDIQALDYPYGWGRRDLQGKKFIEQSGRDPGYVARIAAFLDQDVVVIVLSNIEVGADEAIAKGLESIAFGTDPTPPVPRIVINENNESLKQYEGRYEIAPNSIMDVKVTGDHLFLRGPGGDYLPLEANAPGTFFFKQMYTSLIFHRDNQGRIDSMLWGGTYPCKRIADKPSL
jgi:CubicO group peptidase (beta-lactamase class C family)